MFYKISVLKILQNSQESCFGEITTKGPVVITTTDAAQKWFSFYCACPKVDMIRYKNQSESFWKLKNQ